MVALWLPLGKHKARSQINLIPQKATITNVHNTLTEQHAPPGSQSWWY